MKPVVALGLLCLACATPARGQSNQLFIEFTAAQYRVSEINRTIKLPLRLVGSGIGVPAVSYATQDGTATAGQDYLAQSGQAMITGGGFEEPPLEIFIVLTILDDTLVEGDESFTVSLSNPTAGAALGTNRTAEIIIEDNDTLSGPGLGANDTIRTSTTLPDGRTFIAGDFTSVDGIPRNGIALLNRDGTVAAGFNPGSGADEQVNALTVQTNGMLLVGGSFSTFSGYSRQGLARLREDGSVDGTFSPVFVLQEGLPGQSVDAIAVDGVGRILAAGYFLKVNGIARGGIVRLNPDGSVDQTFVLSVHVDTAVAPMSLQSDGTLLVNAGVPGSVNELLRLDANGNTAWFKVPFVTAVAYCIISLPDNNSLMAGYFLAGLGQQWLAICRFGPDGSLDPTFTPIASLGLVNTLAVQTDGKILAGGDFTTIGNLSQPGIARLQPGGQPDSTFRPSLNDGAVVSGISSQPDGSILIVGSFTNVNHLARSRIARLAPDGNLVGMRLESPVPLPGNQVQVTINAFPPQKCLIQVSEDLSIWTSILTNSQPAGRFEFTDKNTGSNSRFYRSLTLP